MKTPTQLDLIPAGKTDHLHRRPGAKDEVYYKLVPYWREMLEKWMHNVFLFRHKRGSFEWGFTEYGHHFANWLLHENCMTPQQHARWMRFEQRRLRWTQRPLKQPGSK